MLIDGSISPSIGTRKPDLVCYYKVSVHAFSLLRCLQLSFIILQTDTSISLIKHPEYIAMFGEIKLITTHKKEFAAEHWGALEIFADELLRQGTRPYVICFLTDGCFIQFARVWLVHDGRHATIKVSQYPFSPLYAAQGRAGAGLEYFVHFMTGDSVNDLGMLPPIRYMCSVFKHIFILRNHHFECRHFPCCGGVGDVLYY